MATSKSKQVKPFTTTGIIQNAINELKKFRSHIDKLINILEVLKNIGLIK